MVEPHFKGSNGRVRLIKNILQLETYTTMVRKSKAAQSRIKNLGSNAQKQPKQPAMTMEEVEDEDTINISGHAALDINLNKGTKRTSSNEGFIFDEEDGSLTLIGFLKDVEEESLPDFSSDSDSDSEYGAEDNYQEICELSDLEQFSNI